MQAQPYILAIAIALVIALIIFAIALVKTRHRTFENGRIAGLDARDLKTWKRIKELEGAAEDRAIERETEQRRFLQTKVALQRNINELEARISAYTGLAVTGDDHTLLKSAAETLRLAHRTWTAIKGSEEWLTRSEAEATGLLRLAALVSNELDQKPALTSERGAL